MLLEVQRKAVVQCGREMLTAGLAAGSGGNLSCIDRDRGLIAISPSGLTYGEMTPEDVVVVDLEGATADGPHNPSSELAFHLALYRSRPDVGAVVHTHSVYATAMACLHREIPPVHYLIGFAGKKVPVAPYATFGTRALARNVVDTLGETYNGVLLANHGVVTVGESLKAAYAAAESVEFVARICLICADAGEPVALSEAEMRRVIEKFKTYGRRSESA